MVAATTRIYTVFNSVPPQADKSLCPLWLNVFLLEGFQKG
jgi:hypothetical protein